MKLRKQKKDFGQDYLINKKERFISLFLSSIFLKKDIIIEKIKKGKFYIFVKLIGEKLMKYVGNYEQRETIKNHIFDNNKDEFESFLLKIMVQMIEDFSYGYSMEFDLLLKKFFEFITTFKVEKQILDSLNTDFRCVYRSSMTEEEFNKFFDDFISSVVNRIAVFILQEGFMDRLREAVMRCDYSIDEEEVNDVLFYWGQKKIDVIAEEYGFEYDFQDD